MNFKKWKLELALAIFKTLKNVDQNDKKLYQEMFLKICGWILKK